MTAKENIARDIVQYVKFWHGYDSDFAQTEDQENSRGQNCETQPLASIGRVALFSPVRSLSRLVTSSHISTIWCFRPHKPYTF